MLAYAYLSTGIRIILSIVIVVTIDTIGIRAVPGTVDVGTAGNPCAPV